MYFGVEYTRINYLFVQVCATVIVLFWNFVVNKVWTFAHHNADKTQPRT